MTGKTDGELAGTRIAEQYGARVRDTLLDLSEFGAIAAHLVARGKSAYDADDVLRLAGEAIMHRVGEAVARLPGEFIADHPGVEWRKMKQMRNIVAHDYLRVDHEIVWNALTGKMPEVTTFIQMLLAN